MFVPVHSWAAGGYSQVRPAFGWKLTAGSTRPGTGFTISLTSQTWQGILGHRASRITCRRRAHDDTSVVRAVGEHALFSWAWSCAKDRRAGAFLYHFPSRCSKAGSREDDWIAETFVRYLRPKLRTGRCFYDVRAGQSNDTYCSVGKTRMTNRPRDS